MAELVRLQKFFSDSGVLSRRAAEAEIEKGLVKVNGSPAVIGMQIDPHTDVVEYKGQVIKPRGERPYLYLMLNKPRGYVTTSNDEKGRKNVTELCRGVGARVYPIGRLDMDSEGLLLLSDDGDLTYQLTHPRHEIPKIYHVTLSTVPTKDQLKALSAPMELDGYRLQPVGIKRLSPDTLEMTLYEGRNRQIRRMCESADLKVIRLVRVAIGRLSLGELSPGTWRRLTPQEVSYLRGENKK